MWIKNGIIAAPERGDGLGAGGAGNAHDATAQAGGDDDIGSGVLAAALENALETGNSEESELLNSDEELIDALLADNAAEAEADESSEADEAEDLDGDEEPEDEPEAEAEAADEEPEDEPETEAADVEPDNPLYRLKSIPKEHRKVAREIAQELAARERTNTQRVQSELAQARDEGRGAQEQLAAREAELQQVRAEKVVAPVTEDNRLAWVQNLQELNSLEREAQEFDDWLDLHLPRLQGEDPETGEPRRAHCPFTGTELNLEQAQNRKLAVKHDLRAVNGRRLYFEQEAASRRQLETAVPAMRDGKSEWSRAVHDLVAQFPELKRMPNWRTVALAHAIGNKLIVAAKGDSDRLFSQLDQALKGAAGPAAGNGKSAPKPAPADTKPKFPRKPRARPVPAVRGVQSRTTRPTESHSIDSSDDLVDAIAARL